MLAKAVGTIAVWGGVVGLSWMFHSFAMFNSGGAIGLVVAGLIATCVIWEVKM